MSAVTLHKRGEGGRRGLHYPFQTQPPPPPKQLESSKDLPWLVAHPYVHIHDSYHTTTTLFFLPLAVAGDLSIPAVCLLFLSH